MTKRAAAFFSRTALIGALLLLSVIVGGTRFGVVEADALLLRAEANLKAPALALMRLDDTSSDLFDPGFDKPEIELPENPTLAYVDTGSTLLNVRSGPGTAYTTLGQVSGGSVLPVLSNENGWCEVLYQDSIAFLCSDYVRIMTQAEVDALKDGAESPGEQLALYAQEFLGRPYVYGANGPNSFDCSGFTKYVYAHFGYTLNRTATDQLANGISIEKNALSPGDLVFFRSAGTVKPVSHVGLYIGNGDFVHASTTNYQVRIDQLDTGYYAGVYVGGRHLS